jgi:hypothetical protein
VAVRGNESELAKVNVLFAYADYYFAEKENFVCAEKRDKIRLLLSAGSSL